MTTVKIITTESPLQLKAINLECRISKLPTHLKSMFDETKKLIAIVSLQGEFNIWIEGEYFDLNFIRDVFNRVEEVLESWEKGGMI